MKKLKLRLLEAINYDFYKDKIAPDLFKFLVEIDPTTDKKYARWIIQVFMKWVKLGIERARTVKNTNDKHPKSYYNEPLSIPMLNDIGRYYEYFDNREVDMFLEEDAYKVTEDLSKYDLLKRKKLLDKPEEYNIMNISNFDFLSLLINDKYEDKLQQIEDEDISEDEYDKWYEDKEWLVVVPKTERAACKYGSNTKWCTAAREHEYNMFDHYNEQGQLIDIIHKGIEKWQLHFESDQWMDELDHDVGNHFEFAQKELSDNVKQVIYDHTKNVLFIKDLGINLFKIIKHPSFKEEFIKKIDGLDVYYLEQETGSLPWTGGLYHMGVSDYIYDDPDIYSNMDAYSYGYDNPWYYIDDEPEFSNTISDEEKKSNRYWNKDAELYSEDQRSEAGQNAEKEVTDEYISEVAYDFSYDRFNKFDKDTLVNIFNKCLDIILNNLKEKEYQIAIVSLMKALLESEENNETVLRFLQDFSMKNEIY